MKRYSILLICLSCILCNCKDEKGKTIVNSRNAFKDLVFKEFERRETTCNEEEGYIIFNSLDSIKINSGITKTEEGYKLQKGKICDLTYIDCELRIRLERIQNGAYMLYYEYMQESVDSITKKNFLDVDKGKVVFTCDK